MAERALRQIWAAGGHRCDYWLEEMWMSWSMSNPFVAFCVTRCNENIAANDKNCQNGLPEDVFHSRVC